ncbi:aminodeoxychorismate synthase, component I [Halorubellus sp. JP-L1]|uniref:aminodeoxychorismate synthase, component I n=1 Tax=Halorubellus sp. JP-L1 TaxID=2715753 RepID=UPI00140B776C|nr:aminodeoxychorismate synthase, component I [Halorubellus sp. JP-L1]NHN42394.1 aminodeoxychorismate synthase, component I [Halorubellus sp. JP-L1]
MDSPRVVTDASAFRSAARDATPGTRVPVELRVAVDDPWVAYRRARRGHGEWGAFLETTGLDGAGSSAAHSDGAGEREGWGYFAVDPIERFTARPDATPVDDREPAHPGAASPSLQALEGLLGGFDLERGDCDVPYPCGAFGWLSYDLARELESLPESTVDDRGLPHVQVGVYDAVAAWTTADAATEGETTLRVTACPELPADAWADDGDLDEAVVDACYEEGVERAKALAARALSGDPEHGPAPAGDASAAAFRSDTGREAYADRVRAVKAYVREGDTFQANVSHRLRAPAAVHPVAAYDALRRVNPAPYSGYLEFPGVDLVSASPELLLERDGDVVRTEPIAGTRPRGDDADADAALETELASDEKERAEHAMLVDLERNDLGKVCAYGSVDVAEYRRVDRYSEVMHLVSDVTGRLREGVGLADAVGAMFPGGTITGAPKPRTMEIIEELESTRRGPYTGAMAALGFDDRATLNIVIRTLVRHDDEYHLRVGAGIVHDSDPEREYDETLAKARALLNAVDDALAADAAVEVQD